MANSKLIIVEGPQGVGKTTVTDFLRNTLGSSNLYRLSGTSDSSESGKVKAIEMYDNLMDYTKKLENKSINLIFDRTFFSEENYCRLGKKEYSFTDAYEKYLTELNDFDFELYYINLYLSDRIEYGNRLDRENKADIKYSKFSVDNSIKQEEIYMEMSNEIVEKYTNINVLNIDNTQERSYVEETIKKFVNF